MPSDYGTSPHQVVNFAKNLFSTGNEQLNIRPKAFEKVYAVFDRDDHERYHEALTLTLTLAQSYNDRKLRNDQNSVIEFKAIASVPNFELWLLLHFEDCRPAMHRKEIVNKLKNYLQGYDKGQSGHYQNTNMFIQRAKDNATFLATQNSAWDGNELYTDIHRLVGKLMGLKSS